MEVVREDKQHQTQNVDSSADTSKLLTTSNSQSSHPQSPQNNKIQKRIYHHYLKWEDVKKGFYKKPNINNSEELIQKCLNLLQSEEELYVSMENITLEWKVACEVNFTNPHCNKQAWLGQAACFFEFGATDKITKKAWHRLNNEERDIANQVADKIIKKWMSSR